MQLSHEFSAADQAIPAGAALVLMQEQDDVCES